MVDPAFVAFWKLERFLPEDDDATSLHKGLNIWSDIIKEDPPRSIGFAWIETFVGIIPKMVAVRTALYPASRGVQDDR